MFASTRSNGKGGAGTGVLLRNGTWNGRLIPTTKQSFQINNKGHFNTGRVIIIIIILQV